MDHYSDEELLRQFGNKDTCNYAFNLIVRKYQERLYWYVRRIVVSHDSCNDVLQNTFIKAWQNLPKFRADSALYTWLYRIATNEALSFLKKESRRQSISIDDLQHELAGSLESDTWYSGDEMRMKLDKAVLSLPEKQRIIFTLKYFEEKKYEEIAQVTGTSVGALKASYHHAVKKIEKILSPD